MPIKLTERLRRRPSSAVLALATFVISILALVLSMTGPATAANPTADKPKNQIELLTTATGSLQVAAGAATEDQVPIPLADASFTQRAADTILVIAELTSEPPAPEAFCGNDNMAIGSHPDLLIMGIGLEPAGVGNNRRTEAISPPGFDMPRTLTAQTAYDCSAGTGFTLHLKITVLALR